MEKRYYIDPGKGEKMDGCPYSTYEDGHDVEEYIIPPKDYVYTGFKFEPLVNNQIYDGKLVAQFEKKPIQDRLTSNLWKVMVAAIIIVVIGIVVLLAVSIFRSPKSSSSTQPSSPKTETVVPADTSSTQEVDKPSQSEKIVVEEKETVSEPTEKVEQIKEPQTTESQTTESTEQPQQPLANDPNVQFKQEFWTLIHQREYRMDSYHELFVNYKGKVKCEEFDYLRNTILKDYVSFKAWYDNLKKIPESQLQSLKTVDELKKRIQ